MQLTQLKLLIIVFLVAITTTESASQSTNKNEVLLDAMSPFENMIEFALAGSHPNISKALSFARQQAAKVKTALPASAADEFSILMDDLDNANTQTDHLHVAKNALEIFRLLSDNLEAKTLSVPKEVSLLDYAGFKFRVLTASPKTDWSDVRQTVDETARWWKVIKKKVSEKGLRDAFGTLIGGLEEASKSKNLPLLRFAAQVELDLVDLLERDPNAKL